MELGQLLPLIDRYGVSVAILAALGVAAWRILKFLAPRVDKVIDRHLSHLDQLGQTQAEIVSALHGLECARATVTYRALPPSPATLTMPGVPAKGGA